MTMPKPLSDSKLIRKLLEQTKADAIRIVALEKQVAKAKTDTKEAIELAAVTLIRQHGDDIAALKASHAADIEIITGHHEADWEHGADERTKLLAALGDVKGKLDAVEAELKQSRNSVVDFTALNDKLVKDLIAERAKTAELEPRITMLSQQREELSHLLDKVRDRMRRKELQEESAILNRKAVVNVVPGLNRR